MALLYLEDYLDTIESLPVELSRNFTLMRELDARAQDAISSIQQNTTKFITDMRSLPPEDRVKTLQEIATLFKETLKHGEEKVALAVQTYDMVDRHVRRLDDDLRKFEEEQMTGPGIIGRPHAHTQDALKARLEKSGLLGRGEKRGAPSAETPKKHKKAKPDPHLADSPKRLASGSLKPGASNSKKPSNNNGKTQKKGIMNTSMDKKGKDKASVLDMPIDPNEPTYCICNQVSFGDMIACDNEDCPIEWFHYACVGLSAPPKGKWYCPECGGDPQGRK